LTSFTPVAVQPSSRQTHDAPDSCEAAESVTLVVISEGDNEDAAATFALGTAAQGNVRSVTMRAWSPEAFAGIVARIP